MVSCLRVPARLKARSQQIEVCEFVSFPPVPSAPSKYKNVNKCCGKRDSTMSSSIYLTLQWCITERNQRLQMEARVHTLCPPSNWKEHLNKEHVGFYGWFPVLAAE